MEQFAQWLSSTGASQFILNNEKWVIPTLQTIHIVGIGIIVGSTLMIMLRILGVAGTDQTLRQTQRRFAPWVVGALCLLVPTGLLLIVGEPKRELLAFSFWTKMALLALFVVIALGYQASLAKSEERWESVLSRRLPVKVIAASSLLILFCIIILGRLIAYDHVWRGLLPGGQA